MLACLDVDYRTDGSAVAACVTFDDWSSAQASATRAVRVAFVEAYRPGEFYRRKLPCLLRVLEDAPGPFEVIVVDSYVTLDAAGTPGLGQRLYEALGRTIPVVGVAKTRFATASMAIPVLRGTSRNPLWVTSVGLDPGEAARKVTAMDGAHRIPTLLRQVDRLARDAQPKG